MSDQEQLAGYVDLWWQAVDDFTHLLEELPEEAWSLPTDLAGWSVHDVAAHVAHLEAGLAGAEHDNVDIGSPAHVTGMMGVYTEQGVVARKDRSPDELITEIRESATSRHTRLLADPPTDAQAPGDGFAAVVGWTWRTLLRNRPLDVWMHEQDIRRAVGQPGSLDGPVAQHTADYLLESLPMVVGKRVAPPPGTTVVVDVAGSDPVAVRVGDDGRAARVDVPEVPEVRLAMDRDAFIVAAGGRRAVGSVTVEGDEALGRQVLDSLAVTP